MIAITIRFLKYSCFIFLLFLPILANAQAHTKYEDLNAYPSLWLIEGENSKTYILGSVHLLPPAIKWYGDKIEDAFNEVDEVVFEVNMTEEKQRQAGLISRKYGLLASGDSLRNYLSPENFDLLGEHAAGLGIPPQALERLKPWLVAISLSVSAVQKEGWNQNSGVDKYIQVMANERGLKISELETIEAQMATLWDHPLEIQAKMLVDTLEELKDITNITMAMVNSWASGDVDKMEQVFLVPMKAQEEIYNKLVLERNHNWVPIIEKLLTKKQTTMIVAGAAHFIGDDGVVALLKAKGHNVIKVQ